MTSVSGENAVATGVATGMFTAQAFAATTSATPNALPPPLFSAFSYLSPSVFSDATVVVESLPFTTGFPSLSGRSGLAYSDVTAIPVRDEANPFSLTDWARPDLGPSVFMVDGADLFGVDPKVAPTVSYSVVTAEWDSAEMHKSGLLVVNLDEQCADVTAITRSTSATISLPVASRSWVEFIVVNGPHRLTDVSTVSPENLAVRMFHGPGSNPLSTAVGTQTVDIPFFDGTTFSVLPTSGLCYPAPQAAIAVLGSETVGALRIRVKSRWTTRINPMIAMSYDRTTVDRSHNDLYGQYQVYVHMIRKVGELSVDWKAAERYRAPRVPVVVGSGGATYRADADEARAAAAADKAAVKQRKLAVKAARAKKQYLLEGLLFT